MENDTLDRIQREIQEALEREAELRKKYAQINNTSIVEENQNGVELKKNGLKPPSPEPLVVPPPRFNGENGKGRLFAQNNAKGVMHKFIKMRGKLNVVTMRPTPQPQNSWTPEETFSPAKVTVGSGRAIRNGYVPAEEKMRRELLEFQRREEELRLERRKSQPDLMAALEKEKEEEKEIGLKAARSMTSVYTCEDLSDDNYTNEGLKPARSLVDLNGDDGEPKNALSLIRQFERMQSQS